jgi:uncharacterized protein YdaU (DUF1376 family)
MVRKNPPSFDLYPDDLVAGTMHLHPICMGMYMRLLCFQWSHGSIPSDRRQLMQITGAMAEELDEHLPTVLSKFEKDDSGAYKNPRLEAERAKKMQVSRRRSDAAQSRWNGSAANQSGTPIDTNADANEDAIAYPNVDANSDTNSDTKDMPPIRKMEVGSMDSVLSMKTGGLFNPADYPKHELLKNKKFLEVWLRWEQKYLLVQKRVLDFVTRDDHLRKLAGLKGGDDDAIACVEYSISNCKNLYFDGRHRPESKTFQSGPKPVSAGVTYDPEAKAKNPMHGVM